MSFLEELHKPDILDCISHLSSDEVFTPPKLVNEILDTLPQELFTNPNTKFLDPCCKSGVFLREIAKRLIDGLAEKIPDLDERIDHIFKNQLFGLAITELTALLSRRSVYCSKDTSCEFSVAHFDNPEGNIEYKRTYHLWLKDKCMMCGASKAEYDRGEELETHAYSFIHTDEQRNSALFKRLKDMKFDVIIGNPPYQLNDGGNGSSARPLYHLFVEQAKKLNPRYITMIIPARWYAGGKGLDDFREKMLKDKHLYSIVDYPNPKDCFPGVNISGGVCYFLWDKHYNGLCNFTNIIGNKRISNLRNLDEYHFFIRYNEAVSIIHKVTKENDRLADIITSRKPFGVDSFARGNKNKISDSDLCLISSAGIGYLPENTINQGLELINKYQVIIGKALSGHIGETDENGQVKVLAKLDILKPREICTESYLCIGNFDNIKEVSNLRTYMSTKFVRFLLLQALTSMNITKDKFCFVPLQDFNEEWTDENLYKKYGLTQEEIDFIESMIKPMN